MLEIIFIIFVLFQNIIGQLLPGFFSYWDEILCLVLLAYYFIKTKGILQKSDFNYWVLILLAIIIGLTGDIKFGYQSSLSAILRDIIGFIKFPVVFLCMYRSNLSDRLAKKIPSFIPYVKIYIAIVFMMGVVSLFVNTGMNQDEIRNTIHPYMFLYSHPTYLTTGIICLLCILNAVGEAGIREDLIAIGSVVLAMRTKGLAFIAVYVFLKYGSRWVRKLQFLYWPAIMVIAFIVARSKLMLYVSYSNSPRESLYYGAINLMMNCFPIGSGFASFASHISGRYYSTVYNIIHIAGLYDIHGDISPDIGDAGIPYYLGQFAVLGVLCISILIIKMIGLSLDNIDKTNRMKVIYLWVLIAISIPTEAILVNNGFEIAFVLALLSSLAKNISGTNRFRSIRGDMI